MLVEPITLIHKFHIIFFLCIAADPGMGKTASVAMLAVKYANKSEKMKDFDFVFTIQLKYVDKHSSLPELIVNQHDKLKPQHVSQIRPILEGKTKHKVALLLDGYDEYKRGTNKEIDEAIQSGIGNCFLLLTSRPGYVEKDIQDRMDGEVRIDGFSTEKIRECCNLYLGSEEQTDQLLNQAHEAGICNFFHISQSRELSVIFGIPNFGEIWDDPGLLRIPIILLMTCVIFDEKQSLPKKKIEIIGTIIKLMMDRSTLKHFGCKSTDLQCLDSLLYALGEQSWTALRKDIGQLLLIQVIFFPSEFILMYFQFRNKSYLS